VGGADRGASVELAVGFFDGGMGYLWVSFRSGR